MTKKAKKPLITVMIVLTAFTLIASACSCGTSDGEKTRQDVSDALDRASLATFGPWVLTKGESNIETGEPMEAEDKFRIASITKTFTAEMVLILADDGRVGLDDAIGTYVSNVPNGDEITVRMLLNHTSGIQDEDPTGMLQKESKDDPLKRWDPRELFDLWTGGTFSLES